MAAEAESEGDERYFRRCIQLLAAGVKETGGFTSLRTSENEIEAETADGRVILPWSVDYMTWNKEAVPVDSPALTATKAREVWISGVATEQAKANLEKRGFGVRESRPLE